MAKLLSKNEQPNLNQIAVNIYTKSAIRARLVAPKVMPFVLLVLCLLGIPVSGRLMALKNPPFEFDEAPLESLFVRPPPILAF